MLRAFSGIWNMGFQQIRILGIVLQERMWNKLKRYGSRMESNCVWMCLVVPLLSEPVLSQERDQWVSWSMFSVVGCCGSLWFQCIFGLCSYLELRYCKICHPEKSQKDQLQEQFATALMIQYCFSELEWGSLAKLGCPACFIFHPKHHCCTSSVYQGDAVWVSIGGQVWCQQRAVVLAAGCWVSIGGQVWCQQRAVVLAAGCWIVWPLEGSTSTWKKLCITNFFGLDFLM